MRDPIAGLASMVRQAAVHVPFYRRHWAVDERGIPDIRSREDFEALPLITKHDLLNAAPADLLDVRCHQGALFSERTSGSGGAVFEMRFTPAGRRQRQMRFLRALVAVGYRPGVSLMMISSQATATIRHRQRWTPLLRWHQADLDDPPEMLAAGYRRARPAILYGPLSALLELGTQLAAFNIPHRPRLLISTGERLTDGARRQLHALFSAPVADFYGMTEFGLMAYREATCGAYRAVEKDLYLEYHPAAYDSGLERLIASDLRPAAQPLIRFDTGDLVRRDATRGEKPIVEFIGRDHDALFMPQFRRLAPHRVTGALEAIEGVRAFRVVQQADMGVDLYLDCQGEMIANLARSSLARLLPDLIVRLHWQGGPLPVQPGKQSPVKTLAGRPRQ